MCKLPLLFFEPTRKKGFIVMPVSDVFSTFSKEKRQNNCRATE